jgi:hypothetical protein
MLSLSLQNANTTFKTGFSLFIKKETKIFVTKQTEYDEQIFFYMLAHRGIGG